MIMHRFAVRNKQGRIHGNPVADGLAGAVRKPLGIQKCDGPTDRHGKVQSRVSATKKTNHITFSHSIRILLTSLVHPGNERGELIAFLSPKFCFHPPLFFVTHPSDSCQRIDWLFVPEIPRCSIRSPIHSLFHSPWMIRFFECWVCPNRSTDIRPRHRNRSRKDRNSYHSRFYRKVLKTSFREVGWASKN